MNDVPRLSARTLARAGEGVEQPGYDRARVTPGIVHLGVGNFHRAHQAVYVDDCLAADPGWGIVGASLRRPDMRDALAPQDGLYTLALRDGEATRARIIGSLCEVVYSGEDTAELLTRMCDPAIRIVSLTVTEKGYCRSPSTGDLDMAHAGIRADLAAPGTPSTVPGLLAEALRARRAAGVAPFTVLSCDNLPSNGRTVRRVVAQFAAARDEALAAFIESEVAFPETMVDRIVPATTDDDRAEIAALTGLEDAWPVITEPFSQWVIEDAFSAGRPDFAAAGAQMVADVAPFETMKLRMLNGAHSALAYFGQLAGHETVSDAMGDPALARFVAALWDEVMPTLAMGRNDLTGYCDALTARFLNPALRHRTAQIAMDGSQKVPQRLLATIADRRGQGLAHTALTRAVAAWIAYVAQAGGKVDDPMADRFTDLAASVLPDMAGFARQMVGEKAVFGALAEDVAFADAVAEAAVMLDRKGVGAALAP